MKNTKEDFLVLATSSPGKFKEALETDLGFNAEGVLEMLGTNRQVCIEFFSEMLGSEFSAEQIPALLEVGLSTPENMASVTEFIYKNFVMDGENGPSDAGVVCKEESDMPFERQSKKKDLSKCEIPFRDGTKQFLIAKHLKDFVGTKKEFVEYMSGIFEKNGLIGENVDRLVGLTIYNLRKRGWTIKVKIGQEMVVNSLK